MGVRLYPNTTDIAKLEVLAGVPEGTHASLEALRRIHGVDEAKDYFEDLRRSEAFHKALGADQGMMHGFLMFGWGRFRDPLPDSGREAYVGEFTVAETPMVLRANGILADAALCEGLHYC